MLVPGFFDDAFVNTVFDDMFFGPSKRTTGKEKKPSVAMSMKTDVQEFDDHFVIDYELPGFEKSDITAELKDGYLIVKAEKNVVKEPETDENVSRENKKQTTAVGRYIRRERYYGSYERSFYVGENLTQEDIKASFEKGILSITVPKKETVPEVEEKHFIDIA